MLKPLPAITTPHLLENRTRTPRETEPHGHGTPDQAHPQQAAVIHKKPQPNESPTRPGANPYNTPGLGVHPAMRYGLGRENSPFPVANPYNTLATTPKSEVRYGLAPPTSASLRPTAPHMGSWRYRPSRQTAQRAGCF